MRLTEGKLRKIVKESISRILKEELNELHPLTKINYGRKRAYNADVEMEKLADEHNLNVKEYDLSGADTLIKALVDTGYYDEEEAKSALVDAIQTIAYDDENGQTYKAISNALHELSLDGEYFMALATLYNNNSSYENEYREKMSALKDKSFNGYDAIDNGAMELRDMYGKYAVRVANNHLLGKTKYENGKWDVGLDEAINRAMRKVLR